MERIEDGGPFIMEHKAQSDPLRKEILSGVRRAVVKVGSGVLTSPIGLNTKVIGQLASDISYLRKRNVEFILVSSGAIASGLRKLGLTKRPKSVSHKQAVAAVGQPSLMMAYERSFGRHGRKVAQILITRDDFNHRSRYLNARNTIFTLLSWDIIPIINENDTVVADEIKFGDNDNLSAMVTKLTESHILINLTNIDGLYDKDPRINEDASLIRVVKKVDRRVTRYASTIPGFLGTGGMATKVKAAQKVALGGVPTIVSNGLKPHILKGLFAGKEEGTLFLSGEAPLCSRKHWIAFTKSPRGGIRIDKGAERALTEKGKSLLPSGIREIEGKFAVGDAVVVKGEDGEEIGVGLVNYPSAEIRKIMGARSSEIESRLGYRHAEEVIHRDNLVIISDGEERGPECR